MAISPKEKELVAIGISVAAGCKPCTDHHVAVARKARASDEEIRQAADDAFVVRRHAANIMEAYALAHLGEEREVAGFDFHGEPNRITALVCLGAAFAVNCVASLEHHLAAAGETGVSEDDIRQIVTLAAFIKQKAASHVERLVGMSEEAAA
jgi:AhpD family alkylhydroperoxidase